MIIGNYSCELTGSGFSRHYEVAREAGRATEVATTNPLRRLPICDLRFAIRYSPFASLLLISAWLARVIGYQIRSGRATTKKRAGTSPKNKRMPKRV